MTDMFLGLKLFNHPHFCLFALLVGTSTRCCTVNFKSLFTVLYVDILTTVYNLNIAANSAMSTAFLIKTQAFIFFIVWRYLPFFHNLLMVTSFTIIYTFILYMTYNRRDFWNI